jgi:hypothetical protein
MTTPEKPPEPGGTVWDAPNQQTVREDESAPWEEGSGGSPGTEVEPQGLDAMTKAQLLDYAKAKGISPANNDMTKEELRAAIDEAEGGGN